MLICIQDAIAARHPLCNALLNSATDTPVSQRSRDGNPRRVRDAGVSAQHPALTEMANPIRRYSRQAIRDMYTEKENDRS